MPWPKSNSRDVVVDLGWEKSQIFYFFNFEGGSIVTFATK